MKLLTHAQRAAFSLVEVLVSLGCIGIFAGALVFGLLQMNHFASTERNRSSAKQLCQQRIEEVLSVRYSPENGVIPALLSGTTTDEVDIYLPYDNSTVPVRGTRTTMVSPAPGVTSSLKVLSVTVEVAYGSRGKNHTFTMSTVRSPD